MTALDRSKSAIDGRLGDLEGHEAGGTDAARGRLHDSLNPSSSRFDRRDVDRHGQVVSLRLPRRALRQRLVHHQTRSGRHQPRLLGQGDELEPAVTMPSVGCCQRIKVSTADDLAGPEVELGLVIELELVPLDRGWSSSAESQLVAAVEVCRLEGEGDAARASTGTWPDRRIRRISPGCLSHPSGQSRFRCSRRSVRGPRRAGTAARARGQPPGDRRGVVGVGIEQHDAELVPAEPEHLVRRAQRALSGGAELGQQLVADRVAEGVVDLLEVVEVDEQESDVLRGCVRSAELRQQRRVLEQCRRLPSPVSSSVIAWRCRSSVAMQALARARS